MLNYQPRYFSVLIEFVIKTIDKKALSELQAMDWTGNIRELRNVLERMVILCDQTINENDVRQYANPK